MGQEGYETVDDNRDHEEEYLKYLDIYSMSDKDLRDMLAILGIKVRDSEIPIFNSICLGPIQDGMTGEDSEVRLDMNIVRKIGMMVDPLFMNELLINGIVAEIVCRPGKKGEIPDSYRENFRKFTLEQNLANPDWRKRHIK
jgi:hypothetical protein